MSIKSMTINTILWIVGLNMVLVGLVLAVALPLYGIIMFVSGAVLIPPVTKKITVKADKVSKLRIFAPIVFFGAMVTGAVSTDFEQNEKVPASDIAETPKEANPPKMSSVQLPVVVTSAVIDEPVLTVLADPSTIECRVVGVSDGDTIKCLTDDKEQIKVRLNQIDAPESGQDFGSASKKHLSDLIFGKQVTLNKQDIDKYGRTVADIYLDDQYINETMVKDGYAWAYKEYLQDHNLIEIENNARLSTLGLWSQPDPIYPSEYRKGRRVQKLEPTPSVTVKNPAKLVENNEFGSCGSKRFCKQMTSCAEAKYYLNTCGVSRLDRDKDGIPCEKVC